MKITKREINKSIKEAKEFWGKENIDKEGNFKNEPTVLAGYHKRMVAELKAAGML